MILIEQRLDTPVRLRLQPAFATAALDLVDREGRPVTVVLDIESSVTVMRVMDEGGEAVTALRAARGQVRARRWWKWRFWS